MSRLLPAIAAITSDPARTVTKLTFVEGPKVLAIAFLAIAFAVPVSAQTPDLAPGERAQVEVDGPPCSAGSTLTVDVDPTGAVDERVEADNRLSVLCPGAPA